MDTIEKALRKEAADWLTDDHNLMDWLEHVMLHPSDELLEALQTGSTDDSEEAQDILDELIVSVFLEAAGDVD